MKDSYALLTPYVFEYNESNGIFNLNNGHQILNTKGYKTIGQGMYATWYPFRNWISKKYSFDGFNKPSFNEIKQEWEWYIELCRDIKNIEQQLRQTE